MHKVYLDGLNTIDSVEWRHKGYTVHMHPSPIGQGVRDGRVIANNYFICRPNEDSGFTYANDLTEAREAIEEDIN